MAIEEIREFCKRYKHIYCYGAGQYGKITVNYINEQIDKDCVLGFIVSKNEKKKEICFGKKVFFLDDLIPNIDKAGIIVSAGKKSQKEILENLTNLGIKRILCINNEMINEMDMNATYSLDYNFKRNVFILLYHRVANLQNDPQLLSVNVQNFEAQIKYLSQHYNVCRMGETVSDTARDSVIVTFDDGYADNYYNALPILEKYKVPATFFICTGNLDTKQEFWWDDLERLFLLNNQLPKKIELHEETIALDTKEKIENYYLFFHKKIFNMCPDDRSKEMLKLGKQLHSEIEPREQYRSLTKKELKDFSESAYVQIGGHTVTHTQLSIEGSALQHWEIENSKQTIENIINKKIEVFSYPFGGKSTYTEETVSILKKCGYIAAASNYPGAADEADSCFELPRNIVRNWDIEQFAREMKRLRVLYGQVSQ